MLAPHPSYFHILPRVRYILIVALTDSSTDRSSIYVPPSSPLQPPCPTIFGTTAHTCLLQDLRTLNPKPPPLSSQLPCLLHVVLGCYLPLPLIRQLTLNLSLPSTNLLKALIFLWNPGPFSSLSILSLWLDPEINRRQMCALSPPSWNRYPRIHFLEQWTVHSLFCISVPTLS